jgi:hypothetical protein
LAKLTGEVPIGRLNLDSYAERLSAGEYVLLSLEWAVRYCVRVVPVLGRHQLLVLSDRRWNVRLACPRVCGGAWSVSVMPAMPNPPSPGSS